MHINKQLIAWAFCVACVHSASAQTPPMVTKHLYDFATPGGGGYPDDEINDHQAFVDAAAYFQARNGYGTLILEDGEYIMGVQQFRNVNDPPPGLGWNTYGYPSGVTPQCKALVAWQDGFMLDSCFNFTIQGGANTRVRYRDCLYYGTFVRDEQTGVVSSAVAAQDTTLWVQTISDEDTIIAPVTLSNCITCDEQWHLPAFLDLNLRHAAVGTMFTFRHCDSIAVRNVELNGNIDQANLGGKIDADGMQTAHDGIIIWESSRC
ncbi:MAG: hypothetical protein JNL52_04510, partial [Flavobacteriales bacterium]|nr:hypothetical protein [Flavobacteriales bacterium]